MIERPLRHLYRYYLSNDNRIWTPPLLVKSEQCFNIKEYLYWQEVYSKMKFREER
jgi:hypothetical protein